MTNLTSEFLLRFKATQTGGNDFGGPQFTPKIEELIQLANGTGANQADIIWLDERSVNASSNDDIDLAGALTDALGATVAAAELVALVIVNKAKDGTANTTTLTLGQGASNPVVLMGGTSPTLALRPGAALFLVAPDASGLASVAAGSADTLRIANSSGATAKYQIGVLARSA